MYYFVESDLIEQVTTSSPPKRKLFWNNVFFKVWNSSTGWHYKKKRNTSINVGVAIFQINKRGRRLFLWDLIAPPRMELCYCRVPWDWPMEERLPRGWWAPEHDHRKPLSLLTSCLPWKTPWLLCSYLSPLSATSFPTIWNGRSQLSERRGKTHGPEGEMLNGARCGLHTVASRVVLPHQSGTWPNKF